MQKRKKVSGTNNVTDNNNNENFKMEIGLKQSLVNSKNAIRKKFQDLHKGKQDVRELISETYKPIIEPIKSLADEKKKKIPEKVDTTPVKSEIKNESDSIFRTAYPPYRRTLFPTTTKKLSFDPYVQTAHDVSGFDDIRSDNNDDENNSSVKQIIQEQVKQINSADKDNVYGIRMHHGELYMGKAPIKLRTENSQVNYSIKNKNFPVTSGLTELLLRHNPQLYSNQDLETYKNMLTYTSAHKKNYNPSGMIRRSKSSTKYNKIISQLFPEKVSSTSKVSTRKQNKNIESVEGEGVKWWQQQQLKKPQTEYKIFNRSGAYDYKYWDDPNELVGRLRLLVSSQTAGHTGHNNEIIAIIEELREAKIIV